MLIAPKRLKVRTSDFAGVFPWIVHDMTLTNLSEKWAWSQSRDPINFVGVCGRCVPRDSPDMFLTNASVNLEKWAWSQSFDIENFWTLNADSSKTAEDMNFKFDRPVPRDSPDMTPDKSFQKVGMVSVK